MSLPRLNHILVVEDDPDSGFLLSRLIHRRLGDQVCVTFLGSVVECERYALSTTSPVDLLFLDLMLPDGSGGDAYQALAPHVGEVPIIISSAMESEFGRRLAPEVDATARVFFLPKPISRSDFDTAIDALSELYA